MFGQGIYVSDNALLFKGKSFKFQETVESLNGMAWFGPPGVTVLWQPVNAVRAAPKACI